MEEVEVLILMIERIGFPVTMCIIQLFVFIFCLYEQKKLISRNTEAILRMAVANERLAESVHFLSGERARNQPVKFIQIEEKK